MKLWSEKKHNEMTEQERAMLRVYGMMRERMMYYDLGSTHADKIAAAIYDNASRLVLEGMNCNWEVLNEFDYFKQSVFDDYNIVED